MFFGLSLLLTIKFRLLYAHRLFGKNDKIYLTIDIMATIYGFGGSKMLAIFVLIKDGETLNG
jgi:hypothetical protein